MIIGVDFDNTIVCYDALFHRVAVERGLVPASVAANKNAVREHLRASGREPEWTALQGYVYGPRMAEADPFPGVRNFFRACREHGVTVHIISHKTRHPFVGEPYDLHAAAFAWLESHGFFSPEIGDLARAEVFFELTKPAKLTRIAAAGCDVFIDDLPEILADDAFPAAVEKCLFDPSRTLTAPAGANTFAGWSDLQNHLAPRIATAVSNARLAAALTRLAPQLPTALSSPPEPLSGGANNRVHLLHGENGERYLLKEYFSHEHDPRDRFNTERNFYRYAWDVAGVRSIPHPLAWDKDARVGIFSFVEGQKPTADQIGDSALEASLAFFTQLNAARHRPEARALGRAAEACFTTASHLATVQSRLARLETLPVASTLQQAARDFVLNELRPAWDVVRIEAARSRSEGGAGAGGEAADETCLSPSDVGFHNAILRPDGTWGFFDFEYAGWDDPAKFVCDFFCQPAVPVPAAHFDAFATRVAEALALHDPSAFVQRCHALWPVHQIKWCGIMLNEFLTAHLSRRSFAFGRAESIARQAQQLDKARAALDRLFLAVRA